MGWIHRHRTLPSLTILFKTHLFFHSFYLFCWGFFGGGRFTCLPCSYIWKTYKSHASIHDNLKDLRRVRFLMGLNSLNLKATVYRAIPASPWQINTYIGERPANYPGAATDLFVLPLWFVHFWFMILLKYMNVLL